MIESLVALVVYLVVLGIIFGLLLYIINVAPMPEPYKGVVRIIAIIIGCLILIVLLLSFIGIGPPLEAPRNMFSRPPG